MMGDVFDTIDMPISRLTNGKTIKATCFGKAATVPPSVRHVVRFSGVCMHFGVHVGESLLLSWQPLST